jgi:hypothetical protein
VNFSSRSTNCSFAVASATKLQHASQETGTLYIDVIPSPVFATAHQHHRR